MKSLDVAIIGAGIGGLAAAIALQNAGHRVTVYERAPALGEIGAGINLTPNSSKALRYLGVLDAVRAAAVQPEGVRYRRYDTGNIISSIPSSGHEALYGSPLLTVHRADLLATLVGAIQEPTTIRSGHEMVECGERDGNAVAQFANGSEISVNLLVGADGVRSAVRERLYGPQPARFTGHVAFRSLVPADRLSGEHHATHITVWVGGGQHVTQYPVKRGRLINYLMVIERREWVDEGWSIPATVDELRDEFRNWHSDFTEIFDCCDPDTLITWGLFDRDPQQPWHKGPITLVGDAVHPTVPFMAQGGAMALEDAVILTRSLSAASTLEEGLTIFEQTRFERTVWVTAKSLYFGELLHSVADQARIAEERRAADAVLYTYNPVTAPLAVA